MLFLNILTFLPLHPAFLLKLFSLIKNMSASPTSLFDRNTALWTVLKSSQLGGLFPKVKDFEQPYAYACKKHQPSNFQGKFYKYLSSPSFSLF